MSMSGLPHLHLEITSKCALSCYACPRTEFKGEYNVRELAIETIRKIVKTSHNFHTVLLCGDHGDPIYHSDFHAVLDVLQSLHSRPPIWIATNGSYREESWWQETAKRLEPKDKVVFGIDGLEDTNPIYRRNSDWKSIMAGVETLRQFSPVQMHWQWILFKHNQHQIAQGARLARQLKFDSFFMIESSRHGPGNIDYPDISLKEAFEIAKGAQSDPS